MFTRDGLRVVFTRRLPDGTERVHAVSVEGGEPSTLLDPGSSQAAPSPVDDRIVYLACTAASHCVPTIADLATGRSHALSPKLAEGRYMSVAFSRDGKRVAVVAGESGVVEVDAATGAVLRKGDAGNMLQSLRYVRDELWAARAGDRGNVWMADVELH